MIRVTFDDRKVRTMLKRRRKILTSRSLKKQALRAGAKTVEALAKKYVPVDTGALRDSIGVKDTNDAVFIEATEPYATKIEYKERPFMRPAAREGFPLAEKRIAEKYKNAR